MKGVALKTNTTPTLVSHHLSKNYIWHSFYERHIKEQICTECTYKVVTAALPNLRKSTNKCIYCLAISTLHISGAF